MCHYVVKRKGIGWFVEEVQGLAGIVGKVDIWLICNRLINTGEVILLHNI